MEFRYYQNMAKRFANYYMAGNNYVFPSIQLYGASKDLMEFVLDQINELTPESRQTIKEKIGNTLWCVSQICTELNINMSDVALHNLAKLRKQKDSENDR